MKVNSALLHPVSQKLIKSGHPWITKDRFSMDFPKRDFLIIGRNKSNQQLCLFLNDPKHPNIKGRVWSMKPPFAEEAHHFWKDFEKRLEEAFQKRRPILDARERENVYLVFGEADNLPGLFVLLLKDRIVIQMYAFFWEKVSRRFFPILDKILKDVLDIKASSMWLQKRTVNQNAIPFHPKKSFDEFTLKEFGISYKIKLGKYQDWGLYTDMSSIRKSLSPLFERSKSALNLFSYTGAFSLYALKHGAKEVISVDLSGKYLEWLEENLKLNEDLEPSAHQSIKMSTQEVLPKLISEKKSFDLIICDPPSVSTDGKKKSKALRNYEEFLPKLFKLLNKDGHLVIFLNTHEVSKRKFRDRITNKLQGFDAKIVKELKMSGDCPTLKTFKEGDYLKGLVIKRLS